MAAVSPALIKPRRGVNELMVTAARAGTSW